jgi:hypothetical protein
VAVTDIAEALRQWVLGSTDLPDSAVIFAEQNGPRPVAPFAEVRVGDILPVGAVDAYEAVYDASADEGEEMVETSRGLREVPATVRVFTNSAIGASSAAAILSGVQTALGLPGTRDALHAAGVTCFDRGTIQRIPSVLDTKWEGRATLTVRFYAEETAVSSTGYIAGVELTDQSVTPPEQFVVGEGEVSGSGGED